MVERPPRMDFSILVSAGASEQGVCLFKCSRIRVEGRTTWPNFWREEMESCREVQSFRSVSEKRAQLPETAMTARSSRAMIDRLCLLDHIQHSLEDDLSHLSDISSRDS